MKHERQPTDRLLLLLFWGHPVCTLRQKEIVMPPTWCSSTDNILLPGPGPACGDTCHVSQQTCLLTCRRGPVPDVDHGVGHVHPHVHHLAVLVLALVNRQIYLAAAQTSGKDKYHLIFPDLS